MIRRERELEATVHRPAEAEKYRLEKIAEANRNRVILEAEAEAESVIHSLLPHISIKSLISLIISVPSDSYPRRS